MTAVTSPSLTALVCNLEQYAWKALCTSGSALLPYLSKTPVMIFPGDMLLTATSTPTLRDMLTGDSFTPWKSYRLSHDEVVSIGTDAAIIYYRVEATRDDTVFKAICSSTWVREEDPAGDEADGWRMASHQQTLI